MLFSTNVAVMSLAFRMAAIYGKSRTNFKAPTVSLCLVKLLDTVGSSQLAILQFAFFSAEMRNREIRDKTRLLRSQKLPISK